ncbi:FecCD family ABC transporter permease [Leucobacter chinensis]|uniref:FecCD family ABC transporter permease n=1 Tax=Leucobacter chinensis TaxID=2851010 RepID=UPI001C218025|nr:iron ABC transporter permease [Leucobacter chinensis]
MKRRIGLHPGVFVASLVLVMLAAAVSLIVGAGDISTSGVYAVLTGAPEHTVAEATIVYEMRVPRTLTALLVGAALGIAGNVMQALTGNPLADPGILGVNAGAGFAVVVAVGVFGFVSFDTYVWFSLLGAMAVSLVVYALSLTIGRGSPFTVLLSGVAISAVLTGIATALAVVDPARFNALRGWMSGTVAGRDLDTIGQGAMVIGVGVLVVCLCVRPLSQLGLGAETARALGVNVGYTRITAAIAVMLLAGGATALAGPIVFIGLMVPHLSRLLVGLRLGASLVYSALAGGLLLLIADMAGRVLIPPGEAPAGLVTAVIGAPVLAALARRIGTSSENGSEREGNA